MRTKESGQSHDFGKTNLGAYFVELIERARQNRDKQAKQSREAGEERRSDDKYSMALRELIVELEQTEPELASIAEALARGSTDPASVLDSVAVTWKYIQEREKFE